MSIFDRDSEIYRKMNEYTMVRLVRTFHSVGHGAFYTERFYRGKGDDYNVANIVYDCGSGSAHNTLLNIIEEEFKNSAVIDTIFTLYHFLKTFHDRITCYRFN